MEPDSVLVTYRAQLTADIAHTGPACEEQDTVEFINTGSSGVGLTYQWFFGDSAIPSSSTSPQPSVVYLTPGVHRVDLIITDTICNQQATASAGVTIHELPVASFVIVPGNSGCEGTVFSFQNTGSSGDQWEYEWDFGWGSSPSSSTAENPSGITYQGPGMRLITFRIFDEYCDASVVDTLTILDAPSVSISAPDRVCQGDTVQLIMDGESDTNALVVWSFEGAQVVVEDTGFVGEVVWGPTGWRSVEVVVVNGNGCGDTGMVSVLVDSTPVVTFVASADTICEGERVSFTNTGTSGSGWNYEWDFGVDAVPGSSTVENPVGVMYTSAGVKVVQLRIWDGNCSNVGVGQVYVEGSPEVSIQGPVRVCQGDTVSFLMDGESDTNALVVWSFEGAQVVVEDTGFVGEVVWGPTGWRSVEVVVVNGNGCGDTGMVSVLVDSTPVIVVSHTGPACEGEPVVFTYSGTEGVEWSIMWDFGEGSDPQISLDFDVDTVIYWGGDTKRVVVEVRNVYSGCMSRAEVEVEIWSLPEAEAGRDTTICYGDTVVLGVPRGSVDWVYRWEPEEMVLDVDSPMPRVVPEHSENVFWVYVEDTVRGCRNRDSVVVRMLDPLRVEAGPDVEICYGDTVQLSASFEERYQYTWVPGYNISDVHAVDPYVWPESTVIYRVIARDTSVYGCGEVWDEVRVVVRPLPAVEIYVEGDDTIALGEGVQLVAVGGVEYSWRPVEGLSNPMIADPVASPDTTTRYVVEVRNVYGCVDSDSVVIYVVKPEVWVPDAFTPNGDGLNDELRVFGYGFVEFEFRVFDRWGNMVFSTKDPEIRWNGTRAGTGDPLPEGTYVYFLRATLSDGTQIEQKGLIHLIR